MDKDIVMEAFRNCITDPKCKNCPWEQCDTLKNKKVEIPVDLALEVNNLLFNHQKAADPKAPIYRWNIYWCAVCNHVLSSTGKKEKRIKYCSYCGQAVEWDD